MTNIKTYTFNYTFKNTTHTYDIYVDLNTFKEGADSLFFINKPDTCIAQISIQDFLILLKPIGNSILVDEQQGKTYYNMIPDYLYELLDINAEYNLNNLNISILERNHFEFILYKKEKDMFKEYSIDLHKHLTNLDLSLDNFIEELKSIAIFFIQEDFLDSIEFIEDSLLDLNYAQDDFDFFLEESSTEALYSSRFL